MCVSAIAALSMCAPIVRAQTRPSVEERLERLEREVAELKSQLQSRDEQIAQLKSDRAPQPHQRSRTTTTRD
jgi:septal ring factor EnvC (AmiA/AmiB activator)